MRCKKGVMSSIPCFSTRPGETQSRGPTTISHDKLMTRTYCDEATDFVTFFLSPRDLVFRPDCQIKPEHTESFKHHQDDI